MSLFFRRFHLLLLTVSVSIAPLIAQAEKNTAASSREVLMPPPGTALTSLPSEEIPELGSSHLGKILTRYYEASFGGAEHWSTVESLKVSGRIELSGGEFDFVAVQKKPRFMKMSIIANRREIVLSYNGKECWQMMPGDEKAERMSPEESRRFVNSSHFGSLLLIPFAEGKKIEFIDTVPSDGEICHLLRVTMDEGYQVDYYIEIRSFLEVRSVTTDSVTGESIVVVYEDYNWDEGIPIATKVTSFEGGKQASRLEVADIRVNSGVMPWMFDEPK